MYLFPAGFAALMAFLSSGVSFFLLLEGFLVVVASIFFVILDLMVQIYNFSAR